MSFLDNTGLAYFYSKLKEKFVQTVNGNLPEDGNIEITNVPSASNLVGDKKLYSPDAGFIYRTSGGESDIDSGPAELSKLYGASNITGRISPTFTISGNEDYNVYIDDSVKFETQVHKIQGNYSFTYSPANLSNNPQQLSPYIGNQGTWNPVLQNYGLTAGVATIPRIDFSSTGCTISSIVPSTFNSAVTGVFGENTYIFSYDYENTTWYLDGNPIINLGTYGISVENITGDAEINIVYTKDKSRTFSVNYTPGAQGTITIAKPQSFISTGFNQFNENNILLNTTISNGTIVTGTGYVCFCRAVGGLDWGYMAYSEDGYLKVDTGGLGWCEDEPVIGTVLNQTKNLETYIEEEKDINTIYQSTLHFINDGYIAIAVTDYSDLCIHTRWDTEDDEAYEVYTPSQIIEFPSTGVRNELNVSLPIDYTNPSEVPNPGMPAIGDIKDELDFQHNRYIQRIGILINDSGEENLNSVQEYCNQYNTIYDYDDNWIYYQLNSPINYIIDVNKNYTVNDFGTEEITNTTVPMQLDTFYYENLRNKLKNNTLTITEQTPVLNTSQIEQVMKNLGWTIKTTWESEG